MPKPTEVQTEATTHGDPMPNPTEVQTEATTDGEPMPNATEAQTEATTHGVPMTDQTALFPEREGDDMPDEEAMADTHRTLTPESAARATLTGLTCELGDDEVRVLTRIAERLLGGQATYGQLHLALDPREFRGKEAREEVEDALVYLACAWLKAEEVTR